MTWIKGLIDTDLYFDLFILNPQKLLWERFSDLTEYLKKYLSFEDKQKV